MTWPLLFAVMAASLAGSLHCAGMCGPFVSVYSAGDDRGSSLRALLPAHAAYHGGRALTYVTLGAMAGAAGAAIDWAGEAAGLVRLAAVVCGGLVILWGLGVLFPGLRIKTPLHRLLGRSLVRLRTKPRIVRASLLGGFTPLLPCGWLYAFVVAAAGTASPWAGAGLMAAFWLGTVPALLGLGMVVGRVGKTLRARAPLITGVSLILVGILAVFGRSLAPLPTAELSHAASVTRDATGHEKGATPPGSQRPAATNVEVPGGEHHCH